MTTTVLQDPLPRIDIVVQAGRPLEFTVPVLDGAGAPQLGMTYARAHVRSTATRETTSTLYVFATDEDPPNLTITDSVLTFAVDSATTSQWAAEWPSSVGWWDIEITVDGEPSQITAPGTITISPEVTR